ncbi:MAG: hypothetical protein FJ395_05595 [Verrucomicrobia bacterium]|nr:hypothetical protein [Verrucomicrobiota bacterium]
MPNDILDIKPAVPIPLDWWWWAAALTSVAIGAALFWWWKRQQPQVVTPAVAPLTPYEIAMRALQQLREENPVIEIFYTRLSDIVRHYIEERFGLRAPERTTEEFLAEANLPAGQMALLGAFLQECDLVKFARHQPDASDRQRAFAAAEKFVEETKPIVAANLIRGAEEGGREKVSRLQ